MQNPEQLRGAGENTAEIEMVAAERSLEVAKKHEGSIELNAEQQAEQAAHARTEANKEALLSKESGGAEKKQGGDPDPGTQRRVTKKQKRDAYKETMTVVQHQMSAPSRVFSKAIHNPIIEKTSEVIGGSVARPNAIFTGSLTALVSLIILNVITRSFGYTLSGSETMITFIIGWILGLLYDYFRVTASGKRS